MSFLRPSESLRDWLPWLMALDPATNEVLKTRTGGLLRVARIEPPDFETVSAESLVAHYDRIAAAFARLGNGWSCWIDFWRTELTDSYLPLCSFNENHAAQLIDASRRRFFTNSKKPVFADNVFLAVHIQPQNDGFLRDLMLDRSSHQAQSNIDFFQDVSTSLFEQVAYDLRSLQILRGNELVEYLASTVDYEPKPTRFPAEIIASGLATRPWDIGERGVQIGDLHLATVEVRGFGQPDPDTFKALHATEHPFRWCMTLHGLNAEQRRRDLIENRNRWEGKQKGLKVLLGDIFGRFMGNAASGKTDPEANKMLASLDELQADLINQPFMFATCNVHVPAATRALADSRATAIADKLKQTGVDGTLATINKVFVLLADMPGNVGREVCNPRQTREQANAMTRCSPLTGVSPGVSYDRNFGGPALLRGLTRRLVPMDWSLCGPGGDLGHTAIVGPSGGGKSTFTNLMAAQFLRYPKASVIMFDRRRSFMIPCLALGGDWIELGSGGVGVQPLRAVHLPSERAWAQGWILEALRLQGMQLEDQTHGAVSDALGHVADCPEDERTLTRLCTFCGDPRVRQMLQAYLRGHAYGSTFDGVVSSYGSSAVVGLETQDLDGLGNVAPLVQSSVFRAVWRDRLGGDNPKLIFIGEAWSQLENEIFGREIVGYARELRKFKAALVLETQSLEDLAKPTLKVINAQMANHVYMPHPEALRPEFLEQYLAAGLIEEQVRALASAQMKAECLLQADDVTRLISVRLEDDALAICGAIGANHQARAFELLRQGVQPGEEFTSAWLSKGTADWSARNQQAWQARAA